MILDVEDQGNDADDERTEREKLRISNHPASPPPIVVRGERSLPCRGEPTATVLAAPARVMTNGRSYYNRGSKKVNTVRRKKRGRLG